MRITDMVITPIALGDPPLLNAAGLHAPYALRTIVELAADNGITGIAEVPGSVSVNTCLERAKEAVIGADPFNWNALRAAIARRFPAETAIPADVIASVDDDRITRRVRADVVKALAPVEPSATPLGPSDTLPVRP